MRGKRVDKLHVMLSDEEFKAIDDFRFNNRLPSRSDAVQGLMRRELTASGCEDLEPGLSSGAYGVIGTKH